MNTQETRSNLVPAILLCSWAVFFEIVIFLFLRLVMPQQATKYSELGLALPKITRLSLEASDWMLLNSTLATVFIVPAILIGTALAINALLKNQQRHLSWLIASVPMLILIFLAVAAYLPFQKIN